MLTSSNENMPPNMPPIIPWIGELKGLSICLVVLFHMSMLIRPLTYLHGEIGVDMFLFLSGFGITINLRQDEGVLSFYRRRFSNIIPSYWITLVFVIVVNSFINYTTIDMPNTIIHLLCLQAAGLQNHFFYGLSMSLWFVGAISILYIAVPLLKPLIISKQAGFIAALGFVVPLTALVYFKIFPGVGEYSGFMWTFLGRVPDFSLGISAGILFKNREFTLSGMAAFALVTVVSLYLFMLPSEHLNCFWYPLMGISMCCLYVLMRQRVLRKITPALFFLGAISYELYLIHWTVFGFLSQWVLHYITKMPEYYVESFYNITGDEYVQRLASGIGWIVLCVVIAYMLNRFVAYLRQLGLKRLFAGELSCVIYTAAVISCALYFVIAYWVNVPFGVQWTYWGISPAELITGGQLNGLLSNVLSYCLGMVFKFDTRAETAAAFVVLMLILFNLYLLLRRIEAGGRGQHRNGLLLTFALVLFSPDMWRDILQVRSFSIYLPVLILTAGLNVHLSCISARMKLFLSGLLALAATFTDDKGIALWIFLCPFIIYFRQGQGGRREILAYLSAAVLTVLLCIKKLCITPWSEVNLGNGALFTRIVTGIIPAGWSGMPFLEFADVAFISICVVTLFILPLIHGRNTPAFRDMYAWLIIGAFSMLSIAADALGKPAPQRIYQAMLMICVIAVVFIFFKISDRYEMKRLFSYCAASAMILFITIFLAQCETAISNMTSQKFRLEAGRAVLHLRKIISDDGNLKILYPDTTFLIQRAEALEQLKRLDTHPINSITKEGDGAELWGKIDSCEVHGNNIEVLGWAINRRTNQPASNVAIEFIDQLGGIKTFGVAVPFHQRADVEKFFHINALLNSGFLYTINTSVMLSGQYKIIAFTTDIDKHVAHALRSSCVIRK